MGNKSDYQLLFEGAHDAIIIFKPDNELVLEVNKRATEVYGFTREEFIGMSLYKLTKDLEFGSEQVKEALKLGFYHEFETYQYTKKRELRCFQINASVINFKGELAILSINRDITERKIYEQNLLDINKELVIAKDRAEESDRLKSAFLGNMSHEIRTPLNGILGFTDLLKEQGLPEKNKLKYIGIIEKSGERMLNLINDLIDLSKIETHQIDVTISPVYLKNELNYLYDFFVQECRQKGLLFHLNIEEISQDLCINIDKEKLIAIITNLLKNAIKYTKVGFIKLSVYTVQGGFEFIIEDTGIGIPENEIDKVFNRFEKSSISSNVYAEGAGLGLAITKAYVKVLDGEIYI